MSCPAGMEISQQSHMEAALARARQLRVPLSGQIDLTYRCNFRCVHCYAGHEVARPSSGAEELTRAQISSLMSQMVDAGCLFLTFSGGEPLLRQDFVDIYTEARKLGLVVVVFTNASLIRAEHVEVFGEYPPNAVEVSLYGATEETYKRITGMAGAYGKVIRGIELLLDGGVRVRLKSMLLRDTAGDIAALEKMAADYGVDYRVDPLVMPRLDRDGKPTFERVQASEAVAIETSLEARRAGLRKYAELEEAGLGGPWGEPGRLYQCGAGISGFHIDPTGSVRPCLMSRDIAYNALHLGFAQAWRETVSAVERAIWTGSPGCLECPDRFLCGYCPAMFDLEQASPERPPGYVCELGRNRREAVRAVRAEVENVGAR